MTTIYIARPTARNRNRFEAFGVVDGPDDRFVFGVRFFATEAEARTHAAYLASISDGAAIVAA